MKNGNCEIANSTRTYVVRRLPLGDIVCVLFTRSVSEDGVTDIPFSYDRDQPHQSFVIADRVRSQPINRSKLVGRYCNNRIKAYSALVLGTEVGSM
jgi:hypothetical protein